MQATSKVVFLLDKAEKIQIGGIKFSVELVHLSIIRSADASSVSGDILKQIAEKKINIPFLCYSTAENTKTQKTSFCLEAKDFEEIQEILRSIAPDGTVVSILPSVGTCTIYPHRYSLNFLGQILEIVGHYNFPLYSMSTSISAIALNTDFHLLDQFADKVLTVAQLPENHAPFRQEFQLKQIDP